LPSISKKVPWRAVMPTRSMSGVRMHFWQVVTRCYFKEEVIPWAWEFLTSDEWMAIPKDKLHISVYKDPGRRSCPASRRRCRGGR